MNMSMLSAVFAAAIATPAATLWSQSNPKQEPAPAPAVSTVPTLSTLPPASALLSVVPVLSTDRRYVELQLETKQGDMDAKSAKEQVKPAEKRMRKLEGRLVLLADEREQMARQLEHKIREQMRGVEGAAVDRAKALQKHVHEIERAYEERVRAHEHEQRDQRVVLESELRRRLEGQREELEGRRRERNEQHHEMEEQRGQMLDREREGYARLRSGRRESSPREYNRKVRTAPPAPNAPNHDSNRHPSRNSNHDPAPQHRQYGGSASNSGVTVIVQNGDVHIYTDGGGGVQVQSSTNAPATPRGPRSPRSSNHAPRVAPKNLQGAITSAPRADSRLFVSGTIAHEVPVMELDFTVPEVEIDVMVPEIDFDFEMPVLGRSFFQEASRSDEECENVNEWLQECETPAAEECKAKECEEPREPKEPKAPRAYKQRSHDVSRAAFRAAPRTLFTPRSGSSFTPASFQPTPSTDALLAEIAAMVRELTADVNGLRSDLSKLRSEVKGLPKRR